MLCLRLPAFDSKPEEGEPTARTEHQHAEHMCDTRLFPSRCSFIPLLWQHHVVASPFSNLVGVAFAAAGDQRVPEAKAAQYSTESFIHRSVSRLKRGSAHLLVRFHFKLELFNVHFKLRCLHKHVVSNTSRSPPKPADQTLDSNLLDARSGRGRRLRRPRSSPPEAPAARKTPGVDSLIASAQSSPTSSSSTPSSSTAPTLPSSSWGSENEASSSST